MRSVRLLAALLATAAPAPAFAQSDAQTIAELKAQVDALTKRVAELERASGAAPAPAPAGQAGPAPALPVPPMPTPPLDAAANGATASDVVAQKVPAAPIDRALQKPGGAVQVSASSGGGEVAIRIGSTVQDATLSQSGNGAASTETLSLTASAPIAKGKDFTSLGTLDAFTNSSMLKLRWSRFVLPFRLPRRSSDPAVRAAYERIAGTAVSNCVAKAGADAAAAQACRSEEINDDFIAVYDPKDADAFDRLYHPKADLAFGLEGSVGYHKLSFFDAATLGKMSVEKVPLGAKGFVTVFPDASLTSLTASLAYERDWEDQDTAVLCPLPTGSAPIKCVSGAIGAPDRKSKFLAALEFRKQFLFKNSLIPSMGIAPQLTYDFNGKDLGIDVPIYLVPDEKGNLLGGVRLGYTSEKKDFVIGVFVGTAFSFDPR